MTDKITLDEIALDAAQQIEALPDNLHKVQKTARIQLIIFAAITRSQFEALLDFADFLDKNRPSAVQLAISPSLNTAAVRALEWAAGEARNRAS